MIWISWAVLRLHVMSAGAGLSRSIREGSLLICLVPWRGSWKAGLSWEPGRVGLCPYVLFLHTFCLQGLSNTEKPNFAHVGSRPTKVQKCKLLGLLKVPKLFPGHFCHVLLVQASPGLAQIQWGRGAHRLGLQRGQVCQVTSSTLTRL